LVYDQASGLGSVDANVMLTNWNKVTFKSTATNLTLSSTTFAHGTPVTVTSTVVSSGGTPTGSVALVNTTIPAGAGIGTIALTSGTGQASLTSLPAGTYSLVAQYGGDGTFASSTSTPVSLTVTPENSAVAVSGLYFGLDSSGNNLQGVPFTNGITAQYGSFFDIDAKVYGVSSTAATPDGIATGVITVTDNGTAVTTLNLNSYGLAEFQTGSLGAGTHSLVFSYGGDGSFNASQSSAYTITVVKGVPQIYINSLEPAVPINGTFSVPVEVSSADGQLPVGGTITVKLGSQTQTVPLTQLNFYGLVNTGTGTASFNVGGTAGTYALDASYSGDANLQPVGTSFDPSTVTVYSNTLAITTTTLTPSATSIGPDGTLNMTVKVTTAGTHIPTGPVTLYQDAFFQINSLGTQLDATGTAVISTPISQLLGNGAVQFTATYEGDHFNSPGVSAPVTVNANVGDFSLVSGSSLVSFKSGSTGSTTVSVGAPYAQHLTGSVALQCATSSPNLSCSFANSSLTLPSDPTLVATTTVTFTAVAPASASLGSHGRWLGGGVTLALLALIVPMRRRRFAGVFVLLLLANVALLGLSGCSGNNSSTVPTSPTTPVPTAVGNYTATITATTAGLTHIVAVRVAVK
jgi:hypothetical protein